MNREAEALEALADRFQDYQVPLMRLFTSNVEDVARAFARINSGGTAMAEADLAAALAYRRLPLASALDAVSDGWREHGWHDLDRGALLDLLKLRFDLDEKFLMRARDVKVVDGVAEVVGIGLERGARCGRHLERAQALRPFRLGLHVELLKDRVHVTGSTAITQTTVSAGLSQIIHPNGIKPARDDENDDASEARSQCQSPASLQGQIYDLTSSHFEICTGPFLKCISFRASIPSSMLSAEGVIKCTRRSTAARRELGERQWRSSASSILP
jgi:hypothetical protein